MPTKKDKLMEMSIDDFKKKNRLDTVAPLLDAKVEFSYIPLKFIVVEEQVRSEDEITGGEEFQSMVDSIRENGVLEPVLVVEMPGNKYKLVTGERRYRASEAAGKFNIPARILDGPIDANDIMVIQLTENLQRKNLNPYDEAKGYFDLYKLTTKKENLNVDGMIKDIIKVELKPETAEKTSVVNLTTIQRLSGKSISYVKRLVSVLKLPPEAIEALKNKLINMAQANALVGYIGNPRFYDVLNKAIKNKLTAKGIEKAFAEKKRGGEVAFFKKRAVQFRNEIEKNRGKISKQYAEELMKEIDAIKSLLSEITGKKK
ncbi:MAG TPA: ParB/RepB/Spo0J family partition protein [Syntrophorhabdaceae bacterium]|nr:ParB/RepB/Spo0J family partition protein [Pseudomonadota bacterium]HOS06349.1 ParB/RepB/Spo0J family partition protein [Syntrophorhabdaceae bacterium]HOS59122.1 ParB/RepB/Spo0J family partition protein [Syntrophorhabdaceae bacterium]HPL42031.1 ParB/RepB/Spo0J family partition protein [Syntrophorhabdaceae bacterium]